MKGEHFGWKGMYSLMGVSCDFSGETAIADDFGDGDDEDPG